MSKLHIKKGDTVYVNAGEDKGKTGRVLKVLVKEGRAFVEGINMVSKSTKPNAKNPQGGIVKQEASIHLSNLNPVDPKTGKATRVGRKVSAEGTLVRYSKKESRQRGFAIYHYIPTASTLTDNTLSLHWQPP